LCTASIWLWRSCPADPACATIALIGLCQHRVAHALTGYWTKTFTDTRLCTAIVDRLTFNGDIIETGTTSYRLAHTRARQATS
jgi:hypothetical protein